MLTSFRIVVFVLFTGTVMAQPLRDINYNYLYNPEEKAALQMHPVREASQWIIYYTLSLKDTSNRVDDYTIEWSTRESLSDKEGKPVSTESISQMKESGRITLPFSNSQMFIVAKLINKSLKRAWIYYTSLEPNYPVNAVIEKDGEVVYSSFANLNDKLTMRGLPSAVVSYYNDIFPVAQPPFSEAQGKVSRGMKSDSTFTIRESEPLQFSKKGMYLIQTDTNSANGITLRIEDDYPKLARIQTLGPPLVYITTAQEHSRLLQAKNEKKLFDKIVLGITNDPERAKRLMRNYFRRIELANQIFTSYKEGWKTDRGMIYIVFGLPDEVFKLNDREVWNYQLTNQNVSFTFIKSSSVFDPDNYVLLRDKKYQRAWYSTIDLWRSSRF
jgi:GWxTD domain-containing protein